MRVVLVVTGLHATIEATKETLRRIITVLLRLRCKVQGCMPVGVALPCAKPSADIPRARALEKGVRCVRPSSVARDAAQTEVGARR